MDATHVFAGIPVADYPAAAAWYERLFGRPADMHPHDREAVWRFTETGWIYVVEDPERAGRALVTLLVDDLAPLVEGLAERGLRSGPIDELPESSRRVAMADPEG